MISSAPGAARSKFGPVQVESGIISDVHVVNFTADVRTPHSRRKWLDVPVMAGYLHHAEGEGVYVMPEVGASVWICHGNEIDSRAFILGFGGVPDTEATYRSSRRTMNPGDIYLGTRDRNSVSIRRGGIVQVQATPLSQRIYIPLGNMIRDICEAYGMETFAGSLSWEVDRTASTTTGDRPTRYKVLAKELADDPYPVAEMTLGDHAQTEKALSLEVFDKGDDGRSVQVSLQIKKNGDVLWDVEGKWSAEVKGDYSVLSEEGNVAIEARMGTADVKSLDTLTLTSKKSVVVKAPIIHLGGGGVALAALIETSTGILGELKLGGGGEKVVKGDTFMGYFTALMQLLKLVDGSPAGAAALKAGVIALEQVVEANSPLSTKVSVG